MLIASHLGDLVIHVLRTNGPLRSSLQRLMNDTNFHYIVAKDSIVRLKTETLNGL
jgi:hypothetical protein